jgi:pimeloyl-ACP methyl ester carboxylesterase
MPDMRVEANAIELHVRVDGAGPPILLCHGFPELGYSWRHQIPELTAAGHTVITPDLRGFGRSSLPARVEDYDVIAHVADMVSVLDHLEHEQAVVFGHDWGAVIAYHLALLHPERVRAVAGLSVPYVLRSPAPPMEIYRRRIGASFYQAWFQEVGPADELLGRDPRRTITAPWEWTEEWARGSDVAPAPPWLPDDDLAVYVEAFTRTGFTGGLNLYRNIDRNWERTPQLAGMRVPQPAMYLTGADDMVRRFMPGRRLERSFDDLRAYVVLEGAGHWVQQERPREVTAALLHFLAGLG